MGFHWIKPLQIWVKNTRVGKDNYLILRELKYFPTTLALAIIFPLCAAAFEGFGIGFLFGFLQTLVDPNGAPFQSGIRWFDVWILGTEKSDLEQLIRVSLLILASTWVRAIFNYTSAIYSKLAEAKLLERIQNRIFEQLQALALSFYGKAKSGELINILTGETSQLQVAIGAGSFIFTKGLVLIIYFIVLLGISWQLTLSSVSLFALMAVGLSTLNAKIREASFPVSEARNQFTAIAVEFINGIRTVQAFATQDFERHRFYQATDRVAKTGINSTVKSAFVRPLAEGIATSILIGMIIAGMVFFVYGGKMGVASLLTFLFVLFRLVPAIQDINGSLATLNAVYGSVHAIQSLLQEADKPYIQNGSKAFTNLRQSIEFVAVDFGYNLQTPILKDITLSFVQGQTTALVGASGAGKTTLADLVPRFYDPTRGAIYIDGVDLREYDINTLRRRMAIVSQDTFIFNATVRDNIAYGSADATDTDIVEAARYANALEFINEMPDGFETILGDRGVRLSGGQRQRIAIARALLRNPDILILDEATSALDSVSERLIQNSLEKLAVGRTVITIAHRLSTIANADKVIVLEQGQIVEQGKYQELLGHKGALWNYHQMQQTTSNAK